MSTDLLGSMAMPIVISDDEAEENSVARELDRVSPGPEDSDVIELLSDGEIYEPERPPSSPTFKHSKGFKMMVGMGYRTGHGLGPALDGDRSPVHLVLKRPNTIAGIGSEPYSRRPFRRPKPSPYAYRPHSKSVDQQEAIDIRPPTFLSVGNNARHVSAPSVEIRSPNPVLVETIGRTSHPGPSHVVEARCSPNPSQAAASSNSPHTGPKIPILGSKRKFHERDDSSDANSADARSFSDRATLSPVPMPQPSSSNLSTEDNRSAENKKARRCRMRLGKIERLMQTVTDLQTANSITSIQSESAVIPPCGPTSDHDGPRPMDSRGSTNVQDRQPSPSREDNMLSTPAIYPVSHTQGHTPEHALVTTHDGVAEGTLLLQPTPTAPAVSHPEVLPSCLSSSQSVRPLVASTASTELGNPVQTILKPIGVKPKNDIQGKFRPQMIPPTGPESRYTFMPSRTLVMEPLPRKFREPMWIKEWCSHVSGAHPTAVSVIVDAKAGKALIEFTHPDFAKKAFVGPRLTGDGGRVGIRLFWYRSADSKVYQGEIEEGEIREGPSENDRPVQPTKKNKKKRPARDPSAPGPALNPVSHSVVDSFLDTSLPFFPDSCLPPLPLMLPFLPDPTQIFPTPSLPQALGPPPQFFPENSLQLLASPTEVVSKDLVTALPPPHLDSHSENAGVVSPPNGQPRATTDVEMADVAAGVSQDAPVASSSRECPCVVDPPRRTRFDCTSRISDRTKEKFVLITVPPPQPIRSSDPQDSSTGIGTVPRYSAFQPSSSALSLPTPPLTIPSEPRSMRNFSKEPAMVRLSLAREKDLLERIPDTQPQRSQLSENDAPDGASRSPPPMNGDNMNNASEKFTKEEELRRLVLQSKSRRTKVLSSSNSLPQHSVADVLPGSTSSTGDQQSRHAAASSAVVAAGSAFVSSSLDLTLAESFIAETIRALRPPPLQASLSDIAAKQRVLEERIAESKSLMQQLEAARSKQERDQLMSRLRVLSRLMEEYQSSPRPSNSPPTPNNEISDESVPWTEQGTAYVAKYASTKRWPDTSHRDCSFIISDDEDDA